MGISPQIRYAVERALERARRHLEAARTEEESLRMATLQGVAWAEECESLECAVEILKGLE